MNSFFDHFARQNLWGPYRSSLHPDSFDVTQISHHSPDTITVRHQVILSQELDNWPEQSPFNSPSSEQVLLRVLWVKLSADGSYPWFNNPDLVRLLDRWNLRDACHYAQSSFADVAGLPTHDGARIFTVTYHPKVITVWSHRTSSVSSTTNCVMFCRSSQREAICNILKTPWPCQPVSHAMFPAFLLSIMWTQELDATLQSLKAKIREVEARTKHHKFHRHEKPASGPLSALSADMSGCVTKLASCTRKRQVLDTVGAFTAKELGTSSNDQLSHHMRLIKDRVAMQAIDIAFAQQRAETQLSALFYLIGHQDNAMAFQTAYTSRNIAELTLQDSSAMKMLACVAMLFLPGSFLAALMSTPLFEWDNTAAATGSGIEVGMKPQFRLFWAITMPITAVIFGLYATWRTLQVREHRKKERQAFSLDGASVGV